jgi:hypothetical protein
MKVCGLGIRVKKGMVFIRVLSRHFAGDQRRNTKIRIWIVHP